LLYGGTTASSTGSKDVVRNRHKPTGLAEGKVTVELEIHYRLTGMPDKPIPPGSLVEVVVTDVTDLEEGAIEVVIRYEGHSEG
jgi:hypothetical protein